MTKENLEEVIEKRKQIVETVMHKLLGVSIKELNEDLTSRLSYPFEYFVDTNISFKKSKKLFIKSYVEKILKKNLGNISEAAREADINRRTIHRLILEHNIKIENIRGFLLKPEYVELNQVSKIIEGTLKKYDYIIHPTKLNEMYKNVYDASENLLKSLPKKSLSLKEAEEEFEMMYFSKALKENDLDEKKTAKKIGIRYETLHRKMQKLRKRYSEK